MKRIIYALLPVAVIALFAFSKMAGELPIGADMPEKETKLLDISGKQVTLKQAMQKNGLLVMFSCNTCPFVIKNQERTLSVAKTALEAEVGVILINSNEGQRDGADSQDAMKEYAKKQGYKWFYVVDTDSKIADAFDANRTPECFLFDRNGKLAYHGAIDDNPGNAAAVSRNHLEIAIKEMLTDKEITEKKTRSVGCAIKRKD
jgi:thioredoxin-related protein